jgi:hypothetical protein
MAELAQAGIVPSDDGLGQMALFMVSEDPDGWAAALMAVLWRQKTAPDELRDLVAAVEQQTPLAAVAAAVPELTSLRHPA